MPDSLTVSGFAALNALRAELGDAVPIFGGTAGDRWRFSRVITATISARSALAIACTLVLRHSSGVPA